MTPKEFKAELRKFASEIGPKAEVCASIDEDDHPLVVRCSIYPLGLASPEARRGGGVVGNLYGIGGDDFPEALKALRKEWSKHADLHRAQIIKALALAIIRITAEFGSCSDAALRQDFDPGSIERYGEDACAEANRMASAGPFAILRAAKSNAA